MSKLREIPEVAGLDARDSMIRIPPEIDVPITPRVRQIIDSAEFQRLAHISQLGLVAKVYPAAHHTRFEHSLGVYRLALLYLKRLSYDPRFTKIIKPQDAELFMVAALLHDLGHWPFCHPIEDIRLPGVPNHELFANSFLLEGEIADVLRHDWQIQPRDVVTLLSEKPRDRKSCVLKSMLSGPIDIDKMDYLFRDSLHAGVPYGRNFDQQRLVGSLCLNEQGDGIAITEKGKTAAEMMVFARYVMFSEVYWNHAVRSATAMIQRAFYLLHGQLKMDTLFRETEATMINSLLDAASGSAASDLLLGLFGPTRQLYKRMAQFSIFQQQPIYQRLAGRPYPWLVSCCEHLANRLSTELSRVVAPHEIIIDAPPVGREVEFKIDIYFRKEDQYRKLGEVSPVVKTLAEKQFDDYVKRVRIFAHRSIAQEVAKIDNFNELLIAAIEKTD